MQSDLFQLLTEFEIGVPNMSATVDDKLFLGVNCNKQFSMVIIMFVFSPSSKKCNRSEVCCYVVSEAQNRT